MSCNRDQETLSQMEAIAAEVTSTQPLTSTIQPLSTLLDLYTTTTQTSSSSPSALLVSTMTNFLEGGRYLVRIYGSWRRVRGDGNCYYRAFLYSLCESLRSSCRSQQMADREEYDRICTLVTSSIESVVSQGYDRFTVETFHEELLDLLLSLPNTTTPKLHQTLSVENGTSDYATWYLRLLTSLHLQSNADTYTPYLTGEHLDMTTFCKTEVEPMGKECETVQVAALAECLGVRVAIEYLDGRDLVPVDVDGKTARGVVRHVFGPEGAKSIVTLLYRPGHYDILYRGVGAGEEKEEEESKVEGK